MNAGFISILYPFAVFGYALMEEQRPGKGFWSFMIKYTLFILFMKFIFQLDCWLLIDGLQQNYKQINDWILLGLWRVDGGIGRMFLYIMPELVVLLAIMGQIYYEILIGLHDKREIELENIQQARERFLNALSQDNSNMGATMASKTQMQERKDDLYDEEQPQVTAMDENGLTETERVKLYLKEIKTLHMNKKKKMYKEDDQFIKTSAKYIGYKNEFKEDLKPY